MVVLAYLPYDSFPDYAWDDVPIAVNKTTGAQLFYQGGSGTILNWGGVAINSTTVFSILRNVDSVDQDSVTAQYKDNDGGPPMTAPSYSVAAPPYGPPDDTTPFRGFAVDDCEFVWAGWEAVDTSGATVPGVYTVPATQPSNQVTELTYVVDKPKAVVLDSAYIYWLDSTWIGRIAR
jgi:hypothetical protein